MRIAGGHLAHSRLAPASQSRDIAPTNPPILHRRVPIWQRLLVLAVLAGALAVTGFVVLAVSLGGMLQKSWFQEWVFSLTTRQPWAQGTEPPTQPRVPYVATGPEPDPTRIRGADDLFVATNVWSAHLRFTTLEWAAIQPESVPRLRGWIKKDGTPILNNPKAPRPGLAGVFGVAQPWSTATFEFGTLEFTNVAARFKGNGTFIFAKTQYSRPFKIDLAKREPARAFAGQAEINLHNLTADPSFVRDALGYEFYRDAGVPAPRTTYTRLFLTIEGRWERRFLGLYAVIEDPGESWLAEFVHAPGGALFKPVTLDLFADLGDDWEAYDSVYNPKTDVSEKHQRRLIELARLVTRAEDDEFARRVFEFVDLGHLCRFLACETLLSNYDGIFTNGQNFLLWIDPRNDRFGFSPWDLDQSWGQFDMIGTAEQRVRADVFHPWVGSHRFFERVFAVPEFQTRYRAELTRLLESTFVPDRLHRRIDELAAAIRPAVEGHPSDQFDAFERALAEPDASADGSERPPRGGGNRLKPYITRRAAEVRAQLAGESEGLRVSRAQR
ncbi:MAG: CotH kinase family protein [Limisphaerales bacterium]